MDKDQLASLRHSAAHLLAAAVMEIWPETLRTIGPSIQDGFYYDFEFKTPISEKEFVRIEQKMKELVKTWEKFEKVEVSEEQARKDYEHNPYKLELIDEIVKKGEPLTYYKSGNFSDLCRGGHLENPKDILKHFKLLTIAGAYWRGDEKNTMLTRIYGTAFDTKEALEQHLHMLEEAKKRDHKKLGKELDLFVFSDLVGAGLPLWTPRGTLIRTLLNDYVWQLRRAKGYEQVEIPHITKKDLYEKSGHWQKFSEELFKIQTREGHLFAMKPMNCPHHTQIYDRKQWSYKELPQRYANTTMVYRDEQSGELSGLSRARSITQDDAHVFARKSQVKEEFSNIWDIIDTFYKTFGFELDVRLSFHDPEEFSKYLGTPELWQEAERAIRDIANERNVSYVEEKGEAAFYGPKIDFIARDSLNRKWQVATIQLDINMPERFTLFCINESGEKERIVMIHAAIMGSIERFLSILIEHFAGNFPLWLAPTHITILPISDRHTDQARKIHEKFLEAGIRSHLDDRSERLQAKIRAATLQKVAFMGIIGDKECENSDAFLLSVRTNEGKDMGQITFDAFSKELKNDIDTKKIT